MEIEQKQDFEPAKKPRNRTCLLVAVGISIVGCFSELVLSLIFRFHFIGLLFSLVGIGCMGYQVYDYRK